MADINTRDEEEIFADDADSRAKRKQASIGSAKGLANLAATPDAPTLSDVIAKTQAPATPKTPEQKQKADQFAETSRQKLDDYTKQLMEMNKKDPDLSARLQGLSDRLDAAKKEYDDNSNVLKWAEVAETVGHALTKIGAAREGGSKWDSSQIQLPKTNWDAKQERLDRKYTGEVSGLAKQQEGLLGRAEKQEESARKSLSDLLRQEYDNIQQADKFQRQGKLDEASDARRAAERAKEGATRYQQELGLVHARGDEARKTQAEKPLPTGRESPEDKRAAQQQQALDEGLTFASNYQQADSRVKRQLAPKIGQSLGKAGLNPKVSSFLTNPKGTGGIFNFGGISKEEVADGVIAGIKSKEDVDNLNSLMAPYEGNSEASAKVLQARALSNRGDQEGARKLIDEANELIAKKK